MNRFLVIFQPICPQNIKNVFCKHFQRNGIAGTSKYRHDTFIDSSADPFALDSATPLLAIPEGAIIRQLDRRDNWTEVQFETTRGWLPADSLRQVLAQAEYGNELTRPGFPS